MLTVAFILMGLASLVAIGNISGCLAAHKRKKQGIDKGYSNIPLVSLAFSILAWLAGHDRLGMWPFLPAALDPGTWLSLYMPWVIWTQFIRKR
jgi:hypothetical protein